MYSTAGSYLGFVPQLALAPTRLAGSVMALQQLCSYLDGLQLAGGLKKLSRGQKKFLASGWTAYAKSIKRGHNKIHIWSPKPRLCICVASTEHKETSMNDLKMSVALRICCAYTEKKLSSLKIHSMQMLKTTRKAMMQIMS